MKHIKLFEDWNESSLPYEEYIGMLPATVAKLQKFADDTITACEAIDAFNAKNKKGRVITFELEYDDRLEEYGMGRFEDNYAPCFNLGDIETTGTDDYNFSLVFEMNGNNIKGVSVCSDVAEMWSDHHEEIAEEVTPEAAAKAFAACFSSGCLAYNFR